MKIETGYDYSDIYLIPRHGVVESRKDTDTKVKFGPRTFDLPVVPANMKTIVDFNTCKFLANNNLFYIMHRFDVDIVEFCKSALYYDMYVSISVGVGKESRDDLTRLYNFGMVPDYITIDIAHGDSVMSLKMIEMIKALFPSSFLIVGNVATAKGVRTLEKAGADATKVGIGQGCFAAGTRILLANGTYKNIEDINLHDEVISGTGNPTKVVGVRMSGIKKVCKYKNNHFYDDTICTPDHKHYVFEKPNLTESSLNSKSNSYFMEKYENNYGWKEIRDVRNDLLLLPSKINFRMESDFTFNLIDYSDSNKISNMGTIFNDINSSYELGYVFGVFLGDGNSRVTTTDRFIGDKQTYNTITSLAFFFGLNEKDIANKTKDNIKKCFNVDAEIVEDLTRNMTIVRVNKAPLARFFTKEFYFNSNKILQNKFLVNNIEYIRGIIDGLIDSDGTIEEDRKTFTNTSKYLVELYGILSYMLYGKLPSYTKNKKTIGKLVGANINNVVDSYTLKDNISNQQICGEYIINKISSTEDLDIMVQVYDIEVECDTHSFIANNTIVHNSVCTTKDATGFTVPQFTAVVNACQEAKKPVIADGGIRCIGDISKAIVGGATLIMAGSLFSGFNENPQLSRQNDGKFLYYGSASAENKGNSTFVEGRVTTIEPKGSMSSLISSLKDGISSAISYSGGKTLEDMRNYTKYGVFHK